MVRMGRYLLALALFGLVIVPVSARVMAPWPIAERVAKSPVVLVGTVTNIEEKGVNVDGTDYKVAIVKVGLPVKGLKDQTHVRVAFQPMARFPSNSIQKDLDVILFLSPVKGQTHFSTQMYFDIVNKNSPAWAAELESVKKCARVSDDINKTLREGKPDEKLLAAAMLIVQHRTPRNPSGKQVPIDAAQIKAILTALAEAEWALQNTEGPLGYLTPQSLFFRLGVTPADGWTPPPGGNVIDAAKKWLKDNADKFVIKKNLPAEE